MKERIKAMLRKQSVTIDKESKLIQEMLAIHTYRNAEILN